MSEIRIPAAALEAGARAVYLAFTEINIGDGEDRWDRLLPRYRAEYREQARAAFLAMLRAWPGMREGFGTDNQGHYDTIILPLTENPDAKA